MDAMATSVDQSDDDVLLQAILGLLDGLSDHMIQALRYRTVSTYSTRFPVSDVYALLAAVEQVRPGLLAHYAQVHTQGRQPATASARQ